MGIFSGSAAVSKKILLLSGTSEGPVLARALVAAGFDVRATVTTENARTDLFGTVPEIEVQTGGFTEESLADFLRHGGADLVLDATHPFAVRITRSAHAVCSRLGVRYIRYERPDWEPPAGTLLVNGFAAAAQRLPELGERILLTIGSKQLHHFQTLHNRVTLFARILPSVESLHHAFAAGFTAERILCLRPPFSRDFNRALLAEYRIDGLLTKASGREGGVVEKVLAAQDLGIRVLMIQRPDVPVGAAVDSIAAAVAACQQDVLR
jgi:precorrin-6A/cobalt-precorrin-6A reductase